MSASNENPGNTSSIRLGYNQGEGSTKVTTLKNDEIPEVYLRVRVALVMKKKRTERKQKTCIDLEAKRSQERESTENIIHYQFYQHLATNLEKNSHELILTLRHVHTMRKFFITLT